jgi:hypothetical protein
MKEIPPSFDYGIWILNFFTVWQLATLNSTIAQCLCITNLLSSFNSDARTPSLLLSTISFQKLKSIDFKTIEKSKWTLKTKIVVMGIPMRPLNFTSTKSLIKNILSLQFYTLCLVNNTTSNFGGG